MIATVRVMVKQLMELRGGYERNNNQEVSDEQAGESCREALMTAFA